MTTKSLLKNSLLRALYGRHSSSSLTRGARSDHRKEVNP